MSYDYKKWQILSGQSADIPRSLASKLTDIDYIHGSGDGANVSASKLSLLGYFPQETSELDKYKGTCLVEAVGGLEKIKIKLDDAGAWNSKLLRIQNALDFTLKPYDDDVPRARGAITDEYLYANGNITTDGSRIGEAGAFRFKKSVIHLVERPVVFIDSNSIPTLKNIEFLILTDYWERSDSAIFSTKWRWPRSD